MIARIDIRQVEPGQYELRLTHGSHELLAEAGFSSIAEALGSAADTSGPIRGFEVAYENIVIGTYTGEALRASKEAVAEDAVALYAVFRET